MPQPTRFNYVDKKKVWVAIHFVNVKSTKVQYSEKYKRGSKTNEIAERKTRSFFKFKMWGMDDCDRVVRKQSDTSHLADATGFDPQESFCPKYLEAENAVHS